ncbi:hypothetical protein BJ170DRAFT_594512 [Xylariales sp. AK1849]|nr:hypothetical protein BJ170DRAFT_594512 [Xylariales sp. AK1849]
MTSVDTSSRSGARGSSSSMSSTVTLTPPDGTGSSPSIVTEPRHFLGDDSASNQADSSSAANTETDFTDRMATDLGQTRLLSPASGLGMSDIAAALEDVSDHLRTQSPFSRSPSPVIGERLSTPPTSRRRSSSHNRGMPHDVNDEEPPPDHFHEPAFQKAYGDTRKLAADLKDVLGSGLLHREAGSTIQRLFQSADSLAQFRCPSTRTVGFVGDSGVDLCGLARTSNSGAACTCVATEYHYHDSNDLVIEVALFSASEISDQLNDLLQSYRHYHSHCDDMHLADNSQFLIDDPEDAVLETLYCWTREMGLMDIETRQVATTLAECSTLLMTLTSEPVSAQDRVLWPYIRKIKAHILSKGFVLVDLPVQCDEIFAISNIGRATTDAGVQSVVELAKRADLSNVGIICTRSDDIRAEEAIKDWTGPKATRIEQLTDDVATKADELSEVREELAEYIDDDLTEEEREKEMQRREFELQRYLIQTRNQKVTERLHNLYRSQVPGGELKVFCVSNTDYWLKRDLPKNESLPQLQLIGILAVRKHCISIVADSQLRSATKYIQHDITALLSDVELWILSGAASAGAEQKQAIRETLDAVEARLRRDLLGNSSQINTIESEMRHGYNETVHQIGGARVFDWSQAAREAGAYWSGVREPRDGTIPMSSSTDWFCSGIMVGSYSSNGDGVPTYMTQLRSHNWNEETIQVMARDLARPWQNLRARIEHRQESATSWIGDSMDWAVQYLETEIQGSADLIATLTQALNSRQYILEAEIENICEASEANLSTLRTYALSGIRTSFIGQAMETSYRACNQESGSGSDRRRKAIISRTLGREILFESIMKEAKKSFKSLAHVLQVNIQAVVREQFDILRGSLDIVRNENVASESEQDPGFRNRVEGVLNTTKEVLGRIQGSVG